MAWQPWSNNGHRNPPSNSLAGRVPGPMHLRPSQEELAVRCEEIRRIAADNTLVLEDIRRIFFNSFLFNILIIIAPKFFYRFDPFGRWRDQITLSRHMH